MEHSSMNERIKELSNIAYMNHMERNPYSSFGRRYDYDKEFAELIVRECGNWIVDNAGAMEHLGPSYFAKAMQQHFGVTE